MPKPRLDPVFFPAYVPLYAYRAMLCAFLYVTLQTNTLGNSPQFINEEKHRDVWGAAECPPSQGVTQTVLPSPLPHQAGPDAVR